MQALPMNFTNPDILSLVHCTAYISLYGINFVNAFQCDVLSISYDRNPATHIFTTFLLGKSGGDRLNSKKFGTSLNFLSFKKFSLSLYI